MGSAVAMSARISMGAVAAMSTHIYGGSSSHEYAYPWGQQQPWVRISMGAAAAMSAHIYGGSSVIRMIIRNPPWRSGDPQGIPTLAWGGDRTAIPTPSPTPPHPTLAFPLGIPTPIRSVSRRYSRSRGGRLLNI